MRISRVVPIEGPTGPVSDEAGEAIGNAAQPDGRHITLRFPPPMVHPLVSRVEPLQDTLGFEPDDPPFEDQPAIGGPSDRGSPVDERFFASDLRGGPDSSTDDEVVRSGRSSRWVWVAVTCAAVALIGGAVLRNRQQLGASEPMRSQSRPTSRAVAVQSAVPSAVPSTARALDRPEIPTPPAQPEAASRATGEAGHAQGTAASSVGPVSTTARTPPSSAKAPARTRPSSSAHRARRRSTADVEPQARRRQTERVYGIAVGDIYVNSRGELVNAQGKPLDLAAPPDPGSGSAPNPVPAAEQTDMAR